MSARCRERPLCRSAAPLCRSAAASPIPERHGGRSLHARTTSRGRRLADDRLRISGTEKQEARTVRRAS